MRRVALLLTFTLVAVAGCGGSDDGGSSSGTTSSAAPATTEQMAEVTTSMPDVTAAPATTAGSAVGDDGVIEVPAEVDTIQGAVDAAMSGDLILISPGTYHEAVNVTTPELTIRGLDRNTVVLDGKFELDNGIRVLGAGGVAVENMTAINYTANGFFWTGVTGYRGSYLTAYRTGDYGVYAFDAVQGQLDHIYAAGSPDAGVYIGQCFPCDALITDVTSEYNGLGYSGTNSGGNLLVVNSIFRNNRAGIVPNSGSYELCYPNRETTIVGNLVYSNNNPDTAAIDVALLAMGNGILSAGAVRNVIERNRVFDHDKSGIGLVPYPEDDPNDVMPTPEQWAETCADAKNRAPQDPGGALLWDSIQNRVIGNVLSDNRDCDIILASVGTDVSTLGNCFADNEFTITYPDQLETLAPCDGTGSGDWTVGAYNVALWLADEPPPSLDWKTAPLPELEPQENMPDAATAPARPAVDVPMAVDLAEIAVPSAP
jgi:hypothetical protein